MPWHGRDRGQTPEVQPAAARVPCSAGTVPGQAVPPGSGGRGRRARAGLRGAGEAAPCPPTGGIRGSPPQAAPARCLPPDTPRDRPSRHRRAWPRALRASGCPQPGKESLARQLPSRRSSKADGQQAGRRLSRPCWPSTGQSAQHTLPRATRATDSVLGRLAITASYYHAK